MTGPEHYREAERLLADQAVHPDKLAAAQVHATLAQVAAAADLFALSGHRGISSDEASEAWRAVVWP